VNSKLRRELIPLHHNVVSGVAAPQSTHGTRPVILFDGVCHLCNGFVQFVLRRDARNRFAFAPLQSDFAHERLGQRSLDSIVLVEGGQVYQAEAAVFRILSGLSAPWPWIARIARGSVGNPLVCFPYLSGKGDSSREY
jgi:predicted DCC family thiol-disulfide oxidoreductase YuxK